MKKEAPAPVAPSYTKPQFVGAHGCTSAQQTSNWKKLIQYGESKNLSEQSINTWIELTRRESNFCHIAQNPTSTAFGIGQFLAATWGAYGYEKTSDPAIQIQAKYDYIMKRYGSVESAKNFHDINNWY